MARDIFRGMNKQTREQFWMNLCAKFQTYPGNRCEFLKEHNVSSSAFDRWNKKFYQQRKGNIASSSANLNDNPAYAAVLNTDSNIQNSVNIIDEGHLDTDNESDILEVKLSQLNSNDNSIMAAMELVLPDGCKIQLANHADVAMAIRLVQGIVEHD